MAQWAWSMGTPGDHCCGVCSPAHAHFTKLIACPGLGHELTNFQTHPLRVLNNEFSSEEIVGVLEGKYLSWSEDSLEEDQPFLRDPEIKQKTETRDEVSFSLIAGSPSSKSPPARKRSLSDFSFRPPRLVA